MLTVWKFMIFAIIIFIIQFFQIFRETNAVMIHLINWVLPIYKFRQFRANLRKKAWEIQSIESLRFQNQLRPLTIMENEASYLHMKFAKFNYILCSNYLSNLKNFKIDIKFDILTPFCLFRRNSESLDKYLKIKVKICTLS